jgi:hypothetical protein
MSIWRTATQPITGEQSAAAKKSDIPSLASCSFTTDRVVLLLSQRCMVERSPMYPPLFPRLPQEYKRVASDPAACAWSGSRYSSVDSAGELH